MNIVRRPSAGARKRIIRFDERARARGGGGSAPEQHAWFWKLHSPALTAASAARWNAALATLSERRATGERLADIERLRSIASTYRAEIARAATLSGVSEALILAVIDVESRGKPRAVSPMGARGLMQLIPATARRFEVRDPFDAAQNIRGGAAYLKWLLGEFRGDVLLALAGYNAGEGAVDRHRGVPPYSETRDYVVKVLDALSATQELCGGALSGPHHRCALSGTTG